MRDYTTKVTTAKVMRFGSRPEEKTDRGGKKLNN
jgi:hypothetical protein